MKAIRRQEHMQLLVLGHFSSSDHRGFSEDCSMILIHMGQSHDKSFEDSYSLWAEHGRLILLVGLIFTLLHDFIWFLKKGCFHFKIHTSDIFYYVYLLVVVDCRISLIYHCFYYYHIIITITVIIVSIAFNTVVIIIVTT